MLLAFLPPSLLQPLTKTINHQRNGTNTQHNITMLPKSSSL